MIHSLAARLVSLLLLVSAPALTAAVPAPAPAVAIEPSAPAVSAILRRVALRHLAEPSGVDINHWVIAPFYDGLLRAGFATGDPALVAPVFAFGEQGGWMPGYRFYHADDVAVGHAWLDLYAFDRTRGERLAPIQTRLDTIIANPVLADLDYARRPPAGVEVTDRWTWCDALYMAPPTLARLHALTGDAKYIEFLDREYRRTYDRLWDPSAKLFYRDGSFLNQRTPAGKRIFWSRGNGWVYGGLALLLEHLPASHPSRAFYETLFKEMTIAVLATQQPEGLWHVNLDDPSQYPQGETSGSGFFVFGLAWGINQGLLDRATHWPAVQRGWAGLQTVLMADAAVGYVQPIGAAPDKFGPTSMQDYGTGAFLLAGAEVLRAIGGANPKPAATVFAEASALHTAEVAAQTPRAYAQLVPQRKDDLAWENDQVAFRVYGPALRAGAEDSGIDAWTKRVSRPVMADWYRKDREQRISYHKDHGEGLDAYHVGSTRGCGGLGLWIDGKLVTSDTYVAYKIHWTKPDVAEFTTIYEYPIKVKGQPVYEHRITRLRMGERLTEIEVFFSANKSRVGRPMPEFDPEIAIGLVTQDSAAALHLNADARTIAVYEPFAGGTLGTGVIVAGTQPVRTATLPATDPKGLHRHAVILTKLGEKNVLRYRTGFAWSKHGDITSEAAWLDYLARKK